MDITTSQAAVGGVIVAAKRRRRRVSGKLAWIVVAPFAAWATARVAGLERGSFFTQIMTATPYAAAGSLGALLLAVLSRRRGVLAVAVATTAAFAVGVLPRVAPSAQAAADGPTLRVLSTNLLFGHADADAVVELVRRLRPDVVSTQELTPSAVLELDDAGLKELMPYRILQDEYSARGSGLYARYPLTEIPGLFRVIGHNMPAASMTLPGGAQVQIVDVHTYPPLGRQVTAWTDGLRNLPSAMSSGPYRVLVGDFNASLDHGELRKVVERGYVDAGDVTGKGLIPTWPANKRVPPLITIDHVLADQRLAVTSYEVHTLPRTDHRAIFAELRLPGGN
ncbi:endonuclease/exonuclease/phosphatase family protein [Thermopolyspora sp. NPDC052614]|uniref:endonuclease/exonuclease/phosphatase family protein n=1 Tax=Thermopolyspora sp. NPDC052614 TaxID=3155682 RepID=UPI0034414237